MAKGFKASEGAVGVGENPHLGKMKRNPRSDGSGVKCPGLEATWAVAGKQEEGELASIALPIQRRAQWA